MTGTSSLRTSIGTVFSNPGLRRLQLAFLGSGLGDWAYATAVTVWAYQQGGATAVGAFQAARFVVSAMAGPLGAAIADRVPRRTFMMVLDGTRAVLVAAAALCVSADVTPVVVYALALVAVVVGAPFRAAQAGLVPSLARTPVELTASNAVSSNIENLVLFAGPALGALLVGTLDVSAAFWLNAVSYVWSLALVAGVHVPSSVAERDDDSDDEAGLVREATAGFALIIRDADLRTTSVLAATQGFLYGALTVCNVLISVQMLHAGASGVGYLLAISGIGMVVGGVAILARLGRERVASDMAIGVLGWGLPFLLLAAWPSVPSAVVALLIVGFMDPWVNLGLDTMPQRLSPARMVSRVFAAVDASLIGAMSVGSLLAPLMLHMLGLRTTLLVLGLGGCGCALLALPRMRRLDARLGAPPEVALLAAIPIFAPLGPSALEAVAGALTRRTYGPGAVVVAVGERSEEFFMIASGEVEVTLDGRVLRRETVGDVFGEIGLLHDVARSATVIAVSETDLLVLQRKDFLDTVSGAADSRRAAEEIATRRLAV